MLNNAQAWESPSVIEFFNHERNTSQKLYPSEWFFIKDLLKEGISILDIGCARGGFSKIIAEHINDFHYTGVDISEKMIKQAKYDNPQHQFFTVNANDFSVLTVNKYDLVLCLGILHLNENWRDTLVQAWLYSKYHLVFDLRETLADSIEDKSVSYFNMNFNGGTNSITPNLPYNIINVLTARKTINNLCRNYRKMKYYAYEHAISNSAVSPITTVFTTSYALER